MKKALGRIRIPLAAAVLLWAGLHAGVRPVLEDWRLLATEADPDSVASVARRLQPLAFSLPLTGTVGYLPPPNWPAEDVVRRFYLTQYVLTPRILELGTAHEFVIAPPDASVGSAERLGSLSPDPRLAGFALYAQVADGSRVFRRLE
jgi:hypothetical protein